MSSTPSTSVFSGLAVAPPDAIFDLVAKYRADPSPNKINLSVGAYRTAEDLPYVLPCVREAEKRMLAKDVNKEYLPIDGLPELRTLAAKLVYGAESAALAEGRVAIAQSVSGTGALRLAMQLLGSRTAPILPSPLVAYVSNPTWGNHKKILLHCGYEVRTYRYYDASNRCVDVEGMLADLEAAPRGALIVLQACAHNPTGYDLTDAQWDRVYEAVRRGGLFPLFDMAYQGFATGDLERDATAIRRFVALGPGVQAAVCQSFAKNFGLYGERCGTVSFVAATADEAIAIQSQLKAIIRPMYSNPPKHGAHIVAEILSDETLYAQWRGELTMMSSRIKEMRDALYKALVANGTPGNWEHVINQIGMFSYLGIGKTEALRLRSEFHIYLTEEGRISMCGLNAHRAQVLADALKTVLTTESAAKL